MISKEENQERFETWFEEEGKDMLPCKEALKVAWNNGAYVQWESQGNCGTCKHMIKPPLNNRGDIQFPQYCKLTQVHHDDDFFCADFEKKEKQ